MSRPSNMNDIIQWDVATWSRALEFWEEHVDWSKVHHCLELGGRQGGLSLWLAQKNKQVICSDLHDASKTALPLHQKYGVTEHITYEDIDATAIPYENTFDLIVFKSIIGGIAAVNGIQSQQQVFDQIRKALKPGGVLIFAENTIASPIHQFARKKFNQWGSYWRYISINETKTFLSAYSSYELAATGFVATFGRSEKQRRMLATLDNCCFNILLPESWKYTVYGIARK